MRETEKIRGITLIALVVTIVVLLILAGTSITMLAGENGVITQSQNAKLQTEIGEEKEAVRIAYSGAVGEKIGEQVTAQDVQKQLDTNGTEAVAGGNIQVRFIKSGRIYRLRGSNIEGPYENSGTSKTLVEMFKQAQADGCTLTHETCSNPDHLHIGDYLDYVPETIKTVNVEEAETGWNETQTYKTDLTTTWRVLGLNDAGTEIQIISGSPIKKYSSTSKCNEIIKCTNNGIRDEYLILYGAEGYFYSKETLDKISSIYNGSYATETRSMKIEDINKALGIVVEENKVYYKSDTAKTNIDEGNVLGQTYTYKEGEITPESYLGKGTVNTGDTETLTAYYYSYMNEKFNDRVVLWNMLFDNTKSENSTKRYWLASTGISTDPYRALFGIAEVKYGYVGISDRIFDANGNVDYAGLAVRPLISLNSNITENEIPIITGVELEW